HRPDRLRRPDGHRGRGRHGAVHPGGSCVREAIPEAPRHALGPERSRQVNPPVTAPAVPTVPSAAAPAPTTAPRSAQPATGAVARVAVLGASGYSGHEFVRLALGHPGLVIAALVSREYAGRPAGELLPGVDARVTHLPEPVAPDALPALLAEGAFDTLVTCLPHGAWKALAAEQPELAAKPLRIVDLSSDFRDGSAGYVYGLPEAFRDALAGATRIANPGCYPTAATLSLLPALEAGWLRGAG